MQNVKPFFIKVITPLHAGSGSDLGVVDMPIQRESHTGFPKIEASSLKGSIRSAFENNAKKADDKIKAMQNIQTIFGFDVDKKNADYEAIVKEFRKKKADGSEDPQGEIQTDFAGALGFSDARILFFPVKSVRGVFAYVTCPMVLKRFEADRTTGSEASASPKEELWFPQTVDDNKCFVLDDKKNTIENKEKTKEVVILEEYSFEATTISGEVKTSLPKELFEAIKERLVIISDDNFTHFVKNSTEVITRIKIDNDKGTVQQGGLFTEEYLPSESVMYALAIGKVNDFTNDMLTTMQIGGNSTLGKGIVELSIGVKDEAKK